jgi:hypothetical protein
MGRGKIFIAQADLAQPEYLSIKHMNILIPEQDLMEWSGHKRRDALADWLRSQGIPFITGKGGRICCTADAVNLPLLHHQIHNLDKSVEIEF